MAGSPSGRRRLGMTIEPADISHLADRGIRSGCLLTGHSFVARTAIANISILHLYSSRASLSISLSFGLQAAVLTCNILNGSGIGVDFGCGRAFSKIRKHLIKINIIYFCDCKLCLWATLLQGHPAAPRYTAPQRPVAAGCARRIYCDAC